MALSPWPTSPVALTNATATLKEAIGGADLADSRIQSVGAAAAELVEEYAPGAAQALKDEAVVRCAGWLAEQPGAAIRSESVGDISTSYATNNMSALRHSGAMALLTRWKVRRAGAIG